MLQVNLVGGRCQTIQLVILACASDFLVVVEHRSLGPKHEVSSCGFPEARADWEIHRFVRTDRRCVQGEVPAEVLKLIGLRIPQEVLDGLDWEEPVVSWWAQEVGDVENVGLLIYIYIYVCVCVCVFSF